MVTQLSLPLGVEVGLGVGDIVLNGGPSFSLERGTAPYFLAHVYCGQMVVHLSNCLALVYICYVIYEGVKIVSVSVVIYIWLFQTTN